MEIQEISGKRLNVSDDDGFPLPLPEPEESLHGESLLLLAVLPGDGGVVHGEQSHPGLHEQFIKKRQHSTQSRQPQYTSVSRQLMKSQRKLLLYSLPASILESVSGWWEAGDA